MQIKLGELVQRREIAFFAYVNHYAEEDEKKAHKHLYIVPNARLETSQFVDYLLEVDATNPDKPLGCLPCKSSKFADWYLYAIHDTRYLASKGQSRKYHYSLNDVICSDTDFLAEEVHTIDYSKLNRFNALLDAIDTGKPFATLVREGNVPIQQIQSFHHAYDLMKFDNLQRQSRTTHTPLQDTHEPTLLIDTETGEVEEDSPIVDAFEVATWHTKKKT